MTKTKVVICPYCGLAQPARDRCRSCGGHFDALSRQASHNAMGPWFLHEDGRPFQPGCSYETLARLVERGHITRYSILRGPTTKQFWTVARHVPGVAHLLGYCHACDAEVGSDDFGCPSCGVPFGAYLDRNHLGLPEVRPLPGEAPGDAPLDGFPALGEPEPEWTPYVPRTRTVSSFARDDELLGGDGNGAAGRRGAVLDPPPDTIEGMPPAFTSVGDGMSPGAGPSLGEDWVGHPVVRSMQRRIARQQRMIRLMTVVVLLVTVIGVAFNFNTVARSSRERSAAPAGDEPAAETGAELPGASDATVGGAGVLEEDTAALDAASPAPVEPPLEDDLDGAASAEAPSPPAAASPFEEDHRRAISLIARGADEAHPIADRLKAYREALAILGNIAENAPDADRPGGLEKEIAGTEEALERLELKDFFP